MNLARILLIPMCCALVVTTVGCWSSVEPGNLGCIKTPSGFQDEVLTEGSHSCWGRDEMWQVEVRDRTFSVPLEVLLSEDKVNLKFTVDVTVGIDSDSDADKKKAKPLFSKVKGKDQRIALQDVFNTYAARIVKTDPKNLLRTRTVDQILEAGVTLDNELETKLIEALEGTPLSIRGASFSNFDFPEFITTAQEKAKQREIEIREQEASAKKEIVRLEGKRAQKQLEYEIQQIEAKTIADANRLIGKSLLGEGGDRYLRWHEIKVFGRAADGPNNTILLPTNLFNGGGLTPTFDLSPDDAHLNGSGRPTSTDGGQ